MGDSNIQNKNNSNFDVSKELSTLVSKNILPKKIAVKLDSKLKEKNIKIPKEQFYLLIDKITGFLKDYTNLEKTKPANYDNVPDKKQEYESSNMKTLSETIERLEERIEKLEVPGTKSTKVVTTDAVKVPKGSDCSGKPGTGSRISGDLGKQLASRPGCIRFSRIKTASRSWLRIRRVMRRP